MQLPRYLRACAAMLVAGVLTACGGGGGGGGGVVPGGGGAGNPGPLSYTGNPNPAVISATNSGALTANVVGGTGTSGAVSSLASASSTAQQDAVIQVGRRLHRSVRASLTQAGRLKSTAGPGSAIAVDQNDPCESGFTRLVGTLNDDGTGTLTVIYSACRTGNTTLDGQGTMRIDANPPGIGVTDYTLSFDRLTMSGGAQGQLSGSVRSHFDLPTRTETVTENIIELLSNGVMSKSENMVYVNVYNDAFHPTSTVETLSGRAFHSVHGWVDVSTIVPFWFPTLTQDFPENGQLRLTGAGGANIVVTALSPQMAGLALDLDGDGAIEWVATLAWNELAGPKGSNMADSDHDGMHDSWELAYGLDPNNPADAVLDSDGDGASNLAEYRAGTSPASKASSPPTVGLSVTAQDSPDPAAVGNNLTYSIIVSNASVNAAGNAVLTDTLPTGANLVSATASQGSCSASSSTVTCNLGTINGFNTVTATIIVTPTMQGLITNVATITSSAFDPVNGDNSVVNTTLVGQPASGLQAMIDAAAEGSTVLVPPGNYVGGLTFRNRNVSLRSTGGPAVTFIQIDRGTAVKIGPGGAIHGFTITSASIGSAIEVIDTGAVISGNVFEGNRNGTAGFGAAIAGNNASATIQSNIFRNNTCDASFISGVVVFVNSSAPRIVNNVFSGNSCRALNLGLPQFNTPRVINNTFVGNPSAIRVDRRVSQASQVYRNNILVGNGIGLELEFGTDDPEENPVWTNNLVFGNTVDYSGTSILPVTNGNISGDPRFVDAATGNFRLQPGSAAIDVGVGVDAPSVDFDNAPRPVDGNGDSAAVVDIGAFEAQ